jgi:phosphotransferase system IIA component
MSKHRYYVVLEDGDVHWTDNTQHAMAFSEDGISIVIDTQLNVTMLDGQTDVIEDIIPEVDEDDDLDPDDPDSEGDDE